MDFPRAQKPYINEGKEKKTHNRLSLAQSTPSGSNIKDFFVAPRSVVGSAIGNSFASTSATTVSTADGADAAAKVGYVNEFSKEEGGNG